MAYEHRDRGQDRSTLTTLVARVSETEREAVERLARANDRTVSREVRRAIRLYLVDPEAADRVLRESAVGAEALTTVRVSLDRLSFVPGGWPRQKLDQDRVAEFRALYEAYGIDGMPPLELIHVPELDGYLVADGWHRAEAAEELGFIEVAATVIEVPPGLSSEAFAFRRGLETSARASKPLTRREKQLAISRLLDEMPGESDRGIARIVGVDHKTVGRVRERGTSPDVDGRPPSRADPAAEARRLLQAFERAYGTRGLGVADFFLGERTGQRFAAVFRDTYGDEALSRATAMNGWLEAAIADLALDEPSEAGALP